MAAMTAEEAMAKAEEEGLPLVRADNNTTYKNVSFKQGRSRPYQLKITVAGRKQQLHTRTTNVMRLYKPRHGILRGLAA